MADFEENRVVISDSLNDFNGTTVDTEIVLDSIFDDNGIVDGVLGRKNVNNISNGVVDVSYSKSNEKACGNGRWNGQKLEDMDHNFRVGDLVWGKVKSYPWWPGQIYDPRDASNFALKHSQEGRLLVVFFGDGSCSWCLPSQLVPFIENFDQMSKSKDGTSKSLKNAVQKAVDEVGRVLESRLICNCVLKTDHLNRPLVANAGVRSGVFVPDLDFDHVPFVEYDPFDILTKLTGLARGENGLGIGLGLGMVRSFLSAFYNFKCGGPLDSFNEPVYIEGLEDKDEKEPIYTGDLSLAIVPSYGPEEEDENKCLNGGKQRSVAELMLKRNESDDPPRKIRKKSTSVKRLKSAYDEEAGGRKRSLEFHSEEKPKKIEWDEGGKLEIESVTSPRERKKSKYLCPPYTNFASWKIVKYESDNYIAATSSSPSPVLALENEGSESDSESDSFSFSDEENEVEPEEKMVIDGDKKLSFSRSEIEVAVEEVVSGVEMTAVDPFFAPRKKNVQGFVSAFRGSVFVHGADFRAYRKSIGNNENENDDLISDVSLISQKIDVMMTMLEDYCSKISSEEKLRLKDEMKSLMENVENATDKVRIVAENASSF